MSETTDRGVKLKASMSDSGIDALIITKPANQRYLEGFTGDNCFMIASARGNFLMADSRYVEMAGRDCGSAKVLPFGRPFPSVGHVIGQLARENGFSLIGFESDNMIWSVHASIADDLGDTARLVPVSSLVEKIRAVKDSSETDAIAAACRIADGSLNDLMPLIRPGVSEQELKTELDYRLKLRGAEDTAFDTMILFGARSSQPHANSSRDVLLKPGDFILIDYGASKEGYKSDTTRTFVCGRASCEQKRAYDTLISAQRECVSLVRPGANGRDLNQIAVSIIRDAGFPPFEHALGHGVGLEIHEPPSMRRETDSALEPGMVVTVEPGIYIPGWGGIRIEDTVLVTGDGGETLTNFPKDLLEL
jgi:Xaa-Pro aminopeptidase